MNAFQVYILISFISLVVAIALFLSRRFWIPRIPSGTQLKSLFSRSTSYTPLRRFRPGAFTADLEAGFSSSNFDLTDNILSGDSRSGLDDNDKAAISRIMAIKKVGFDEARRILNAVRMEKNGIDPKTGRPLDPRAVMFS